jgi:hypothetical protein
LLTKLELPQRSIIMEEFNRRQFVKSGALVAASVPFLSLGEPFGREKVSIRDFAESKWRSQWLQHSVLGGPSFDAFDRVPGNPIWQGAPPLEWPVNCFLFIDPVSGHFFAYLGAYTAGYISKPSRCIGLRSKDKGKTWEDLGTMIAPDGASFDKGGHTPDVSVVYEAIGARARYHMIYDWGEPDFNREGGIAYAWADRPEGPWHRNPEPITRNTTLPLMKGRYRRTYAATLIKRKKDWLITGMMDDAPRSWALFVMTASKPEGPYTERKLVREVTEDYFHPPLLEFFPSFVHDGYIFSPATSVAMNRDHVSLFRAPIEKAHDVGAWELIETGGLWHSEPVPSEFEGLWGQVFSGQVDVDKKLWALFNSRNQGNLGTVHLANRAWDAPFRQKGFVLNAHGGPTLTLVRSAYKAFVIEITMQLSGTARLLWDFHGLLGPGSASSDASVAPIHSYCALEMKDQGWEMVVCDADGKRSVEAADSWVSEPTRKLTLRRSEVGNLRLEVDKKTVWKGWLPPVAGEFRHGPVGWWLAPRTFLKVSEFSVTGESKPARFFYNAMDALLGAGEDVGKWQEHSEGFLSSPGFAGSGNLTAKWNVTGRRFTVWCPRGPAFGSVEIWVNGVSKAKVNLNSRKLSASKPIWISELLPSGNYAIKLRPFRGPMVVDCLEVEQ